MKAYPFILILLLCIAGGFAVPAAAGPSSVSVTSYEVDPQVPIRGDTATVTVAVQNTGTESVAVSRAMLYGSQIGILDSPYQSVGEIGAGTTREFTFPIKTAVSDGIHYLTFVLDFREGGSLRYQVPIRVESTDLAVALVERPDVFSEGRTDAVTLRIGNPRSAGVTGVSVAPEGEGYSVVPSSAFIGALAPDQAATVTFNVTPEEGADVSFRVSYRNGVNTHSTLLPLPLIISEGKRRADPVLTNIDLEANAGGYRVNGDIINAGLETARSVIVTVGEGATPEDPYRIYVVGALDPDDFSSFEVTFSAPEGTAEVPLVIQYRDDEGNIYRSSSAINLGAAAVLPDQGAEGFSGTAIAVVALIAIAIGGAIFYSWRKAKTSQ
ncbi:MAG: hypothetical protein KO206_09570 [Methanomicrobiaceae archaeon]|uniref:S-layer domain n=1 Tax=hydrocarbon metagenome TaxID=938273 RepID=A0A0W8FEE5_9ZZZZ|nr:hypothetical protein [Methanomicrobiaceae archaeon]MDD5420301.1 CARDB domain-containing protein [Methanomicrobiaceae archaeon]